MKKTKEPLLLGLERALEEQRLNMVYQPKVSLRDGSLVESKLSCAGMIRNSARSSRRASSPWPKTTASSTISPNGA